MLTVPRQQQSFSTHEWMFLWKCEVFEAENVSTWGGLEPPIFGFMPNYLTIWAIRAKHLLSHVFEYWLWRYRYFEVKLTFEMLTVGGQQHSISTHERMFLWQCQNFFYLRLNKRSKQSWGWWFETQWCSLWRHCNATPGAVPIWVIPPKLILRNLACLYLLFLLMIRQLKWVWWTYWVSRNLCLRWDP